MIWEGCFASLPIEFYLPNVEFVWILVKLTWLFLGVTIAVLENYEDNLEPNLDPFLPFGDTGAIGVAFWDSCWLMNYKGKIKI